MANLVPLHIDKETGRIVAQQIQAGENSTNVYSEKSFIYEQVVPESVWLIQHNGGTNHVICQIYDPQFNMVYSDEIRVVDINTIEVTFSVPQSGWAHMMMLNPTI